MNRKKIILKLSLFSFALIILLSFGVSVSAATVNCLCKDGSTAELADYAACDKNCASKSSSVSSCAPKATPTVTAPITLDNPLSKTPTIELLVAHIINFILGFVGSVSLLLFVYGGIIWMTSAGNTTKITKGRDVIIWAIIGLGVVFTSYIAVRFVIEGITTTVK